MKNGDDGWLSVYDTKLTAGVKTGEPIRNTCTSTGTCKLTISNDACSTHRFKLAIFHISSAQYPIRAQVAVVYFMAQSCLHVLM